MLGPAVQHPNLASDPISTNPLQDGSTGRDTVRDHGSQARAQAQAQHQTDAADGRRSVPPAPTGPNSKNLLSQHQHQHPRHTQKRLFAWSLSLLQRWLTSTLTRLSPLHVWLARALAVDAAAVETETGPTRRRQCQPPTISFSPCRPAAQASFQRLHTQPAHPRTCHRPP